MHPCLPSPSALFSLLIIFFVTLGAGILWRHIECVRAYRRDEW